MHDNVELGKANIMKLNEKMKHRHYSPHALAKIMGVPYTSLRAIYPRLARFPILYHFYTVVRWIQVIFGGRGSRAIAEIRSTVTPENERSRLIEKMCRELNLIE